jgi:hypothetical protein
LLKYLKAEVSSPNKPVYLAGQKPPYETNLYIIPNIADGRVQNTSVFVPIKPCVYTDRREFVRVYYFDKDLNIWNITLRRGVNIPYLLS